MMNNKMKDRLVDSREEQKVELLEYMKDPIVCESRNRMGCSENWYDPRFAIDQTFSIDEIEKMTPLEVDHLFRLAMMIGEGLY